MTHFSKSPIRRLTCLILAILLTAGVFAVSATAEQSVTVEPIAFRNPDFVRGMDVSSVIALEKSGVIFRNRDGDREDIFKILADNGVNTIRVRVWNDPYDSNGNGYGGGNNDVATAAKIGQRAAKYGLNLLVDFHYSDFWADPGKQKAPKAWANMTLSEKTAALKAFTTESLKTIRDAGAHITMVQIGNETNLGIAGENSWTNMAQLYNAGSQAVREFSSEIRVMIHYTNPENTYIRTMADFLHDYQVDYDIFATSYYPCWHGSLENLTDTLSYVAEKYDKYTMVAETSYPYTLSDSDGHANTISEWNNCTGENMLWDFTPQGQADEVRAVMNAVNNVKNGKGLGMCYWEGAWITVGDVSGLSSIAYSDRLEKNKARWERDGSGWASSFCAEFDPDDAGKWYGGSAVDNQAFFSPDGAALPSLGVFRGVLPQGAYRLGDADGDDTIDVIDVTVIQRKCAKIDQPIDETTLMHGDINENGILEIVDAAYIQRYLINAPLQYPIGIWKSAVQIH